MAEFSYCLLAESDTELDEKQKQTIERYFQVRRKSGGGDCKVCQLSQTLWEVSFLDPEAQKRVLEKREHLIKTPDGDILVTVKKDEKPWDNISAKPQKPTLQKAPSSENGEQLLENKVCNHQTAENVTKKEVKIPEQSELTETSECADFSNITESSALYKTKQTELGEKYEAFQSEFTGFLVPSVTQKMKKEEQTALGKTVSFSHTREYVNVSPSANIPDNTSENESRPFTFQGKTEEKKSEEVSLPSISKFMFVREDFDCQMKQEFPELFYTFSKEHSVVKICGPSQYLQKARGMLEDLLESVKEHMLTLSHYKIKFLKSCNPDELNNMVFSAFQSPVTLLVDKNVMLYGASLEILNTAEKVLDQAIHEVIIEVKMAARGATATQEWTQFTMRLKNNFNHPTKQVDIFSSLDSNTCSEIIIAGIFSAVKNVECKILKYLNENAMTQDSIEIKDANITKYMTDILVMLNIEKFAVQVTIKHSPPAAVMLIGIKCSVEKAKCMISKALDSLRCESLSISKPGARKYFHGAGKGDCVAISRRTKCLIKLKSSSMDYDRHTASDGSKAHGDEVCQLPIPEQTHAKLQDEMNALDKAKISEKDKGTYSLSSSSVTDTECVIINGVNIDISLGNIVTEAADVIVNSTNFFHGQTTGVAKAIFDAAGQAIVEQVKQGKMPPNRVFCTGPGNLKSIAIMHICCNNDLKIVEKAVVNVILECERRQYKSVAFPAIGTGQGGMESRAVANAMMNGVDSATKTQSLTHLSTVRIVIYQKDTFQTFRETVINFVKERMQPREHSNLTGHSTSLLKSNKTTKPYGVQDNLLTSTSFLPAVFDLVGLSHDSVQKAKQELQFAFQKNYKETSIYDNQISSLQPDETHKLLADISESEAEITVCQGVNNKISVKGLVQDVDMASQVIHSILESKRENEMRDNKSKNKNPDVHETMNAKPKDSTPENGEPSDKSMVSNAGLHRPEFNKSLFASKDDSKVSLPVSSKAIDNEPQVGAKDVNEDKEMLKVSTSTNSKSKDKKSIANNILSRKSREDELKGKVSTVHDPENDRLMATGAGATNFGDTQSVSSTLTTQWYCKQDGEYVPFEKDTSLVIESEFAKRSKDVVIPFKGKSLIIDLERKEATILETTEVMKVKRVEERADGCLPLAWDEMPENNTSVNVELKKDSREYKDVECHFMETVKASKIVRIERVQNTQLWQQFEVWKKSMAAKNGPAEVKEKLLFHATVRGACNTINERGFNKDLQGQNGQYYGDGIYFTTDASVSANDKYSKMDENGLKYVYRARVLTGRFTKGKRGMRVPPLRTGTDLSNRYDSLVNKESKPTIFVVCNPYYSYPEYLIIFQKH